MDHDETRLTIERYWDALGRGDLEAVSGMFADDVEVEWPQSGEHFRGKEACLRIFTGYPGGSPKVLGVKAVRSSGDLAVGEAEMEYPDGKRYQAVAIVEFRDGKIVRETDYFAERFPAPEWRMQWVEHD